ncbi:hypothetical protein ERICIII_04907 (plasmid) [Paenibacillus larvae subsp. larvae]|uniref:Uncharacterized protein n=1 Tax=Paenibacillus larvae subsp. larvae TaxID=147375 RepID=A0A2L1U7J5_9BACL|nr:hypothetical protein ERICIII_04907 [Paenibacillus larvae subsp. larvae]
MYLGFGVVQKSEEVKIMVEFPNKELLVVLYEVV